MDHGKVLSSPCNMHYGIFCICVGISIIQNHYVLEITSSVSDLKKLKITNYTIYVCAV